MQQYLALLSHILANGHSKSDRTGTGTKSIFGYQMRFNLQEGFPVMTTKKLHLKSVIHELLWFLSGSTNIRYLKDNGVRIWDEWADTEGNLGPVYGYQWRSFPSPDPNRGAVDQISEVISTLKTNPDSRRMIVCAWNPGQIHLMRLPPCHCLFQFWVHDNTLSCQLYQRSCDVFLGVPFNITSYALLTHMIAHQLDMKVGEFIWTGGDVHLYDNHLEQSSLQLSRKPFALPKLKILSKPESIFAYKYEDFVIENYQAHPHISAPIAV